MRPQYASTREEGEISFGVWLGGDYWSSRRRIFLFSNSSSCAAAQFHSDVSLKAVDQRASNNSNNGQWTTEGDVSMRHLLSMTVNDGRAFSKLSAESWSTTT